MRGVARPPGFALTTGVSSLSDQANLLVAALDLNLVRLLRGAMRAADAQGAAGGSAAGGCGCGPAATYEPRPHVHPEPVIEPRPHLHPQLRIEPRPVLHPTPRVNTTLPIEQGGPVECIEVCKARSPIEPPWKVLPWPVEGPRVTVKVKRIRPRTDIITKGSLIDCFI